MADVGEDEQAFLQPMQGNESNHSPAMQEVPTEHVTPTTAQPAGQKQPQTIGGFILDDDEDDSDEDEEPSGESIAPSADNDETNMINSGPPNGVSPAESESKTNINSSNLLQSPVGDADRPSSSTSLKKEDIADEEPYSPPANDEAPPFTLPHPPTVLAAAPVGDAAAAVSEPTTARAATSTPAPNVSSAVQGENTVVNSLVTDPLSAPTQRQRLPNDTIGILEDRIKEDPKGDLEAWNALILEHRRRNKLEEVRSTYDRFLKIFPQAADKWVEYANLELENNDFYRVEQIFSKSLLQIPHVKLWTTYLDYVRRRNSLVNDATGNARTVVSQAYDFVLNNIGIDKDAGQLWQDYVHFLRDGPGVIGGTTWQDQQKMDLLRKAYQKAICIPTQSVNALWKEYDNFEMGLNKATGRKFLQEKSPSYVTARSSNTALQNITQGLHRNTVPILAPALGFDGELDYSRQVELWKRWIQWEKEDPLVLKDEDEAAYKARVLYVYKQALMALRFWPAMWSEAAEFCFENKLESDGEEFLKQGSVANPESALVAFQRADRIESTTTNGESQDDIRRRGDQVREPYNKVLDALYSLDEKIREREKEVVERIRASNTSQDHDEQMDDDDEDDQQESTQNERSAAATAKQAQIEAVQRGNAAQLNLLSRTISHVWIALMRAMRRVQGKGQAKTPIGGSRAILGDARKRGRLNSEIWMASALIEYHCYKDPAATRVFERGMKLFPEDEGFALAYLKHLIAINDVTNARAVFETTVDKLTKKAENVPRTKSLFAYFYEYEASYGELSQIKKLEKRMSELFPGEDKSQFFSQRHTSQGFDPTAVRLIVSPSQTRPKSSLFPSIEQAPSAINSPRPSIAQVINSPKRPLDDSDNDSLNTTPRKIARADSPLKGAAGRRLETQKRTQLRNEVTPNGIQSFVPYNTQPPAPQPLPREVHYLLSILPRAELYSATRFKTAAMLEVLRTLDLAKARVTATGTPVQASATPQYAYGQPQNGQYGQMSQQYGYGR